MMKARTGSVSSEGCSLVHGWHFLLGSTVGGGDLSLCSHSCGPLMAYSPDAVALVIHFQHVNIRARRYSELRYHHRHCCVQGQFCQ
jgi:hypothetical protein